MKMKVLIGSALAATLAVAAFAQMPAPDGPPPGPKSRAEVQAMVAGYFKAADTSKDGVVTQAEFAAARDAMKAKRDVLRDADRKQRVDQRFAKLDKDGNGTISKAEFDVPPPHGGPDGRRGPGPDGDRGADRHHRGHDGRGGHGGRMMHGGGIAGGFGGEHGFDRADANRDGKLTLAEASAGPLAMFDKVDTNHDGKISSEERTIAFEGVHGPRKDRKAD